MSGFRHATRWGAFAMVLAVAGIWLTSAPADDGNPNPGVLPPQSKPRGLSYGGWEAKWWQALAAIPANPDHPFFVVGAFEGQKNVVFLTGVGGSPTINITIRPGTALFFPMINAE